MTALDTTTTGPATASVPIIPPRPYREIYYPSNRRLLERVEPIKPSDIARRKADVELLRGLQDFGKEIKIGDRRSA